MARSRKVLEASLANYFSEWEIVQTQRDGDGEHLALALAAHGCEVVIAGGGDGTASEVADGLMQVHSENGAAPALAVLPCGTGIDFARGLGTRSDIGDAIARIAAAKPRRIDIGRVSFVDDHGLLASRHILNVSSIGLSVAVCQAVNADRRKGRVSAKALFYWRTITEFVRFRFQQVRVTVDAGEPIEARVAIVAACNGRFFGGGMMISPDAELDDGQFDVVIVRAAGKLGLIRDLRLLYGGRHRNHPAVTILRGRSVLIEPIGATSPANLLVEADGEVLGHGPITIEMLPGGLTLRA